MRILCITIGLFSMMSCQRGCTFRSEKTLDQAEDLRQVGNLSLKLIARHVKHTSTTIFKQSAPGHSSASYSVKFGLELAGEFYDLDDQDAGRSDQHLETALKLLEIQHSTDLYYLSVIHRDKIVLLLQRIGQQRYYPSPYHSRLAYTMGDVIDFNRLPTEAQFVDDVLMGREAVLQGISMNRQDSALLQYLAQQKWTESQCEALWKNRHQSNLAWELLRPQKVAEMGKQYPAWRKKVLKESTDYIANEKGFINDKNADNVRFFIVLADAPALQAMDRKLAGKWGDTFEDMAETYFLERMKQPQTSPLDAKARQTINSRAAKAAKAYLSDPGSVSSEEKRAFRWLAVSKNEAELAPFLTALLKKTATDDDAQRLVQESYGDLPPAMQQQVLKGQQQAFLATKNPGEDQAFFVATDIGSIYEFLDGKVACGELEKLRSHYLREFPDKETFLPKSKQCGF